MRDQERQENWEEYAKPLRLLRESGVHRHLGLVATARRYGVVESSNGEEPSAVELGLEGRGYKVKSDQRRCKEAQAALPKSWDLPTVSRMKSAESLTQFIQTVDHTLQSFGKKHAWAGLGEDSEYLRPHVVRKISLKAAVDTDVRCWGPLDRETLLLASPDRGGHLKEVRAVVFANPLTIFLKYVVMPPLRILLFSSRSVWVVSYRELSSAGAS